MSETVWDPLRRREVKATPEERVRQWFIAEVLSKSLKVPLYMMASEVQFSYGEKVYRADILIMDRNARRLAVVECKRPEVDIDSEVLEQALRYNSALDVRYLILTNGHRTIVCGKQGDAFVQLPALPDWQTMLKDRK